MKTAASSSAWPPILHFKKLLSQEKITLSENRTAESVSKLCAAS